MEKEFEFIDHTADVGIVAYGANTGQAFANAAKALFTLIAELGDVAETVYRDIEVTAPDQESLLVTWLNELIYLFDVEHIIFKRFDISQFDPTHLKAKAYGELVDTTRHKLKIGVKAATYHMLKVEENNGSRVKVILDI